MDLNIYLFFFKDCTYIVSNLQVNRYSIMFYIVCGALFRSYFIRIEQAEQLPSNFDYYATVRFPSYFMCVNKKATSNIDK